MESERKRAKGSFFNFFDWNGKSRKKLFLNNTELTEGPKQGEGNASESLAKSQLPVMEMDDTRENSSNKGSSDLSCTSSVTSEEGYGRRAPGVVARLMGLNSLPTSNVAEPSSTPFLNPSSFTASQCDRSSSHTLWSDYNSMDYLKVSSNQEGRSSSSLESRSRKVQNRPIERFQAELLPPKSAKSVPVTHNKLLSPIRSPGFIPSKNAAYIMEAAAKIIEASPKANINGKMPTIRSPSVPLKIRDLKQKMETAQAASKPSASRNTKGQHCDSSPSGPEGILSRKASTVCENGDSGSVKTNGKSTSLAIEVRSNVQRREGSTSRNSNIKKQKEQKEVRSNQSPKRLPGTTKTKRTENRNNNVLRQNNQEQNRSWGKESPNLQNSKSNQASRKAQTMNGSVGQSRRTSNRGVVKSETSRKMRLLVADSVKAKPNNISMKKPIVNDELQIGRSVSDNASSKRDERSIKCNIAVDGGSNTAVDNRKNGMDVVSFTFTSPVKKATTTQSSVMGKSNNSAFDLFGSNNHPYFSKSTSFPGLNVIGGDALGVLLEQKLRELANKVESSRNDMIGDETSASSTSSLQDFMSTCNVISTVPASKDRGSLLVEKDNLDYLDNFDYFSIEDSRLNEDLKRQGSKEMEDCSSSSNFSEAEKDLCQHSSPISILEPSFESGNCSNTNVESGDACGGFSTNKYLEVQGETELSDSASSIPKLEVVTQTFTAPEAGESTDWELVYVREVINNAEQMFKDSRLHRIPKVIYPHLFHQLENQDIGMKINEEEHGKLGRKILFDCISECLELVCGQTFVGSYKSWAKTWTLFERKDWLAKELYKEISGWRRMGDLMVDELVDKDMSSRHGRWLDFSMEAFEEAVEINNEILNSLFDELVTDLFTL